MLNFSKITTTKRRCPNCGAEQINTTWERPVYGSRDIRTLELAWWHGKEKVKFDCQKCGFEWSLAEVTKNNRRK